MEPDIKSPCNELRAAILQLGEKVRYLHKHTEFECEQPKHSEMHANITLAYRHLEDARMRLGKVIQAFDGGVSSFDK